MLQLYTGDKTFDPSTGIPCIELEAQELLTRIKEFTAMDTLKTLQDLLQTSPETVINECNALVLKHGQVLELQATVNKFITLTEKMDKMAWHDPRHEQTFHELSDLLEKNISNRAFIKMVEVSRNSLAIEKLQNKIEEQQEEQHTLSR